MMFLRLACAWGSVAAFLLFGDTLLGQLGAPLPSLFVFLWLLGVIIWSSFGVVHEAEDLAERLGEPYGTLILTLSIVIIEVALVGAVMLGAKGAPTLGRDTMFAVLMIVLNGVVGIGLLIGGLRHFQQRYNLKGASSYLAVIIPLTVIPLFLQMRDFGLLDTRLGLILIYTAMGLPSTIFIMTGFLRTLPVELEEAARIDGASEPRIMLSIMLPLSIPPMVIAAIQNAVPTWNDFFFPLVFIQTDARKTLPQGLSVFMGEYTTDWGMLFAGLTIAALPLTIVYILMSRQFIRGMTAGAVK